MGIFEGLFGGNKDGKENDNGTIPWKILERVEQLEEIKKASAQKSQIIFKNSTTCGISRMVLNRFENAFDLPLDTVEIYMLDLLRFRTVSNAVAEFFNVQHESPQILVIKNGEVVVYASHYDINQLVIKDYL